MLKDNRNIKELVDRLIDWIEFYAESAMFQPCNGGKRTAGTAFINLLHGTRSIKVV